MFGRYHSGHAVAAYILAGSVVTLIATAMVPDYTGRDIEEAHRSRRSGLPQDQDQDHGEG